MDTENNKESNVKTTIDAVTGLAKAVPVYQDAVQPAAKEIGKSLETVTKTVNIALAPIKALVWGYERIEDFLTKRVSEKLQDIPDQNITTPPPHIAGPAVEALRYSGHNESLRELYASLLATAMNKSTTKKAHPSFVEVIKNLTPEEAALLQIFVSQHHYPKVNIEGKLPDNKGEVTEFQNFTLFHKLVKDLNVNAIPVYIDNLNRLGIIEIFHDEYLTAPNLYEPLENDEALNKLKTQIQQANRTLNFRKGLIRLTSFGKDFVNNVVAIK